MRYHHFAHIPDPGMFKRKLTHEQVQRVIRMKDNGLTWGAIAAWFSRNGVPISYQAVRNSYQRAKA